MPLGAGPLPTALPGPFRYLRGQGIRAELARTGGDFSRAGDGEHVADLALFQCGPQLRVAAVDLVPRNPTHAVPSAEESADHAGGQLRLGREDGVLVQARSPAAVRVACPRARNVQLAVHCRVSAAARVDEIDGDLGVLNPARGAGVLALHTNGVRALLHIPGLVDHQQCVLVVQMLQHVLTHVVTHAAGIPPGPAEQVLHAVRTGLPGPLGNRPAVLAWQVRQQPAHEVPRPKAWFDPREPRRYPAHQTLERLLPPGRVYAVSCGHRMIFVCPHSSR
ncbi:hypothetical protein GCM10018965_039940 [Nonomuraea roseola]